MKITYDKLKEAKYDSDTLDLFGKIFPNGIEWNAFSLSRFIENFLDPEWMFENLDLPPTDETREEACKDPRLAFEYALHVDKGPRDDTRNAACRSPIAGWLYAQEVDKHPRDETRTAACRDPYIAFLYAAQVDKCQTYDTREAVYKAVFKDVVKQDILLRSYERLK